MVQTATEWRAAPAPRYCVAEMLSVMKAARQSGASLFLAYEQGEYARVIEGEAAATETLERTRAALEAQRTKP